MYIYDVVILTDARFIDQSSGNPYVQNVLMEDQLLRDALEEKGLRVHRKDWADIFFDWSSSRTLLFRTTWDYATRRKEFYKWLKKASAVTHLINSADIIHWNLNKKYLQDLSDNGVRIVPSEFINSGNLTSLKQVLEKNQWDEGVVKPVIGAGGKNTFRINPGNLNGMQAQFEELLKKEDLMIQPFQHSVPELGEWSYMIFGDTYSHAVVKNVKEGEFRVQDDFGGTVRIHPATAQEIDFALQAKAACPGNPCYTRVDAVLDNEGHLAVSEIELIEPELWFRFKPEAAHVLADEVLKVLKDVKT